MYQSLYTISNHADAVSIELIKRLDLHPKTIPIPPYNDGSQHWIDNSQNICEMVFPAVFNTGGKFSRMGPYFNIDSPKVLSPTSL